MAEPEATFDPVIELWNERRLQGGSSEAVYATLKQAILGKALRPGQTFAEEDLAGLFGVSRTPVREAILRLESDRLVERRARRRVTVSEISPTEILEIYDVRVVLDGLAAQLAAQRATPPELAQLRWLNDRLQTARDAGDLAAMSSLSLEWHEWLARGAGNSFLLQQIRALHDRVRRFEPTTFRHPGRGEAAMDEHAAILAAVEAGDVAAAGEAAKRHMLNAKTVRLALNEANQPSTGPIRAVEER